MQFFLRNMPMCLLKLDRLETYTINCQQHSVASVTCNYDISLKRLRFT